MRIAASGTSSVGTWAWAERTNGRLRRRDRAELLRQGVLARLSALPARVTRRLNDGPALEIPTPPDSALALLADERVRELSVPELYGHCLRTWAFAAMFAARAPEQGRLARHGRATSAPSAGAVSASSRHGLAARGEHGVPGGEHRAAGQDSAAIALSVPAWARVCQVASCKPARRLASSKSRQCVGHGRCTATQTNIVPDGWYNKAYDDCTQSVRLGPSAR
jgi:hypothetical protein